MRNLAFVVMVMSCGAAQASNWVSIAKSDNGKIESFIDVESIRINGNIRRSWFKTVYAPRSTPDADNGKYLAFTVDRTAFNCSKETKQMEAMTIYYEDGSNPESPSPSLFPTAWEPVQPDTGNAANMAFICAWKPK